MEKKNQNKKFQELVKKIETLKETEQGKLKGGFATLPAKTSDISDDNGNCGNCGNCACG